MSKENKIVAVQRPKYNAKKQGELTGTPNLKPRQKGSKATGRKLEVDEVVAKKVKDELLSDKIEPMAGEQVNQGLPRTHLESDYLAEAEKLKDSPREKGKVPNYPKPDTTVLTEQEEVFVHEIIRGSTQKEAYLKAYPEKVHLAESTVASNASKLFNEGRVQQRHADLLRSIQESEKAETLWKRETSRDSLVKLVEYNMRDIERINEAYEREKRLLLLTKNALRTELLSTEEGTKAHALALERVGHVENSIIRLDKERRNNKVNNDGIVDAIKEINRMYGYDKEADDGAAVVVFAGFDEIPD